MLQKEIVIQQAGNYVEPRHQHLQLTKRLTTSLVTDSRESLMKDEELQELLAKKHLIGTTEEFGTAYSYLQQELAQAKEQLTRYV